MNEEMKKDKQGKITEYKAVKKPVSSGTGAVVYVPKDLIGEEIQIIYPVKK